MKSMKYVVHIYYTSGKDAVNKDMQSVKLNIDVCHISLSLTTSILHTHKPPKKKQPEGNTLGHYNLSDKLLVTFILTYQLSHLFVIGKFLLMRDMSLLF